MRTTAEERITAHRIFGWIALDNADLEAENAHLKARLEEAELMLVGLHGLSRQFGLRMLEVGDYLTQYGLLASGEGQSLPERKSP